MAPRDVSDDDLAQQWQEILSATGRLDRLLDADLERAGIPAQWYPALQLLLRSEGHRMPMSTLARELTMTSGGFSKLADRMAADGLIDRRGTVDDRRVVHATLTDAGLELARTARAAYVRALRNRVAEVGSLAAVAEALRHLAVPGGDASPASAAPAMGSTAEGTADEPTVPEQVADERDPALPDRRGRGRRSGVDAH